MFFTQEDYRKIEKWFLANSRKDTDFAGAATPLKGNETVVLVQNGKNVKASVKDVVEQLFLLGVSDFVNITDKYDESYISLSQAIELIPYRSRKIGQVITFLDDGGRWSIYQFQGERKNQWNTLSLWVDLIDLMTGMTIADSEDIVAETNIANQVSLKFADKTHNENDYSGLGRVYLRKNIVDVVDIITGNTITTNLLQQSMIGKENTIYHIQYDYNLNGQTITIPDNCILEGHGGSIIVKELILMNNVTIKDVTFKISTGGTIILGDNSKILNCNFITDSYGKVDSGILSADSKSNIIIDGCIFSKQARQELGKCSSIDLRNCNNFNINNCTSDYTEGENIICYGGYGIISNNTLFRGWSGIGTSTVEGSTENTGGIAIINNSVHNAIAAGITINSDNVLCQNNTIDFVDMQRGGPGIRLGHSFSKANNCHISGNNIISINSGTTGAPSSDRGISLDYGTNNVISNNYIRGFPSGIASSIESKSLIISENKIYDFGVGINVYAGNTNYSEDDNVIVSYNTLENKESDNYGIWINNYNSVVRGNIINITGIGIRNVTTGNLNCAISDNKIYSGTSLSFEGVSTGDLILESNDINSTSETTIQLLFGNCKITNNVIESLQIYPCKSGIISNNTFIMGVTNAIYVDKCIKLQITGNTFNSKITKSTSIWVNVGNTEEIESIEFSYNSFNTTTLFNVNNVQSQFAGKIKPSFIGYSTNYPYNIANFIGVDGKLINSIGYKLANNKGSTTYRPTLDTTDTGFQYFDTTLNKTIWWNGTIWVDSMGLPADLIRGNSTTQRPSLGENDYGYMYYDTILKKYITWNGNSWINLDGTSLT